MNPNLNEGERLGALHRLNLLDTAPSESFDRITRMASQIFDLPIAAVSLTDRDRQWFKSRVGLAHHSIPREKAPCAQVAEQGEAVLIPDLQADDHYCNSNLADQGVRFYAGAALTTKEGYSLGALCVLGTEPRETTAAEMGSLNDLAKMVMDQIELQHAFGRIDPLSGLPNRTQFLEDLTDQGCDQPGQPRFAALIDLVSYEQLNNGISAMGAAYLDKIVEGSARIVSSAIGHDRTAYHVAATQFAILAPPGTQEETFIADLHDMLGQLRGRSEERFITTASVGVAPFVSGETAPAAVLRTIHSAAQAARSQSPMLSTYSPASDSAHQRQFHLLGDFSLALMDEEQLSLVFQPRIDLTSHECTGAEALLRWNHPTFGQISPAEFIPIVEQTSLAEPLLRWVLDAALQQLSQWHAEGRKLRLSINVSAANLKQAEFAQTVQLLMLSHRVRPEWLELEITESAVMGDITNATNQLKMLVDTGIQVAIDDFGTGHSSLAYLQRLPANIIKIDQSFILNMHRGPRERQLVRSMISLAQDLEFQVVAEGVETAEARDCLLEMGCDEAQGYLYGRPMAAENFVTWFEEFSGPRDELLRIAS